MTRLAIALLATATSLSTSFRDRPAPTAADPAQQSIEAEILAVHAQMREAAERLDAAALYAHVLDTETPPIIENGRVAETRSAALERTARGFQGLARLSYAYTRQSIAVISPTTALWVGEGSATATLQDGREVGGPFAETLLFVRRDGQWKVMHAHRSTPSRQ